MKRILIFTGDGKGKTTAALGTLLRAVGYGKRCLIVQFIKGWADVGELAACGHLPGVEVMQMGRGFSPQPDSPQFTRHQQAAEEALELVKSALESGKYDLLLLDEICYAITAKLIDERRVIELLHRPSTCSCIILTGRNASPTLMEHADTVTEMKCIRHALQTGIAATPGVEY